MVTIVVNRVLERIFALIFSIDIIYLCVVLVSLKLLVCLLDSNKKSAD